VRQYGDPDYLEQVMASLKKLGKIYYIYQDERIYFDPANPPMGKTKATKGKVTVRVQRALDRGWNYYYQTIWHSTGETVGWLAERKLEQWNRRYATARSNQKEDVLLRVAIERLGDYFKASHHYAKRDRYVLSSLSSQLGNKSLGSMRVEDWDKYAADEAARGVVANTIQRRFYMLRTIFRESKRLGFFDGAGPFAGVKVRHTASHPRQISLEVEQQAQLLKACWDPALASLYRSGVPDREQVKGLSYAKLEALGYPSDQFPKEKVVEYLRYQDRAENMDPQTLRDLVQFELVFGLRLAEIIGQSTKKDGEWQIRGGLRVSNYDPVERTLVVVRSKQKREQTMKAVNRKTTFPVPEVIAEILDRHCNGKQIDDLIFTRKSGEPFEAVMIARPFEKAAAFSGIEVPIEDVHGVSHMETITFRDLRHVATSNMMDTGMECEDVARYLGHSTTKMLYQVYYNTRTKGQLDKHREGFGRVVARLSPPTVGIRAREKVKKLSNVT
jgi:integrase